MPDIYFTADTHFSHANIIKPEYADRPFETVEEMDEALIENWNDVVKRGDFCVHLGDFGYFKGDGKKMRSIFNRLNGQKRLIIGNHDGKETLALPWSRPPEHYAEMKMKTQSLVLFHYGQRVWNKMRYGALHLYGHSHDRLPALGNSLDVGVDSWNYRPVSIDEIRMRLAEMPTYQPETERGIRIDQDLPERQRREPDMEPEVEDEPESSCFKP